MKNNSNKHTNDTSAFDLLFGGWGRWFVILTLPVLMGITSCSTTKNLPDGEVLYGGIRKVEVPDRDQSSAGDQVMDEVQGAISYPPNNSLLGSSSIRHPFAFKLWVYNAFVNKKGKFNEWMLSKFGGKPIFISTVNPDVRSKVAQNLLHEHGYLDGKVSYSILPNEKNSRTAKLDYRVEMNHPYTIDSVDYSRIHTNALQLLQPYLNEGLLKKGDQFNLRQLQAERSRIASILRNRGYYYYRPDFLSYEADTILNPGKVSLRVVPSGELPSALLHPWKVGNVSVWLNGYDNEQPTDSISYKEMTIHYQGKLRVRPSVLHRHLHFKSGDTYSLQQQERTQTALSRLGIFRYSEMQFTPKDSTIHQDTLNLRINTVYDLPLDGELEVNVTAKSNNYVGPGAVFGLTKRNVFGGGETFNVKLRGSYEWQTGNRVVGSNSSINSYELAVLSTLALPGLVLPWRRIEDGKYPSTTSFHLNASQMNRARFFKLLAFGGDASYEFQTSAVSRHVFTPFKLTFNLLQSRTAEFDSIMNQNPALYQSLQNQFIPVMGYTYTYDNSSLTSKRDQLWAQFSVTQAGLLTNTLYTLAGRGFNEKNKDFLGNPFAQFIKGTAEVRYNHLIGKKQRLVGRVMIGAAYSYGNAVTTPYNEQFYIGGANSLRAFTIRSIGPGNYNPDPNNRYAYVDQTGDLKFEANLEYRFPILGSLEGALFLDCGNVWLIRHDPKRPGGQLSANRFLNDLALGTGVGARYVLPFLVVRFDMGIGLHVPFDTGKEGYFNIPTFKDGLGLHLAIGYPF